MKIQFKKALSENYTLVSFLFIIYVVISLVQWYSFIVEEEVELASHREMQEVSSLLEHELESMIDKSVSDLSSLAITISNQNIDKHTIPSFLRSQAILRNFKEINYINLDGQGVSADNQITNFSTNKTFFQALKKSTVISNPNFSLSSGEFTFELAVQVQKNETTNAILWAHVVNKDFGFILERTLNCDGTVFLFNKDLDVLYNSEGQKTYKHLLDLNTKEFGIPQTRQALIDIAKNQSGSFIYRSEEQPHIFTYTPIQNSDWILVTIVPIATVNSGLDTAVSHINSVSAIILSILLILIVYTWYTKTSLLHSVEQNAYYDPLTGLRNALKFKHDMKQILEHNKGKQYTIVKCDIENFTTINEMFGFEIGNKVLKAFMVLQEKLKDSGVMVARVGVDEFLFFVGEGFFDNLEKDKEKYEKYHKKLLPELSKHNIVFKYGRYNIEHDENDVDIIVNKVSHAHKMAKENKNVVFCDYDHLFIKKLMREAEINDKKEVALENEYFKVYLQPKFEVATEKLIGAEALVRWIENDNTMVYPDEFIPLFEKNGFIVQLDNYMLEKVCQIIKDWLERGLSAVPISVNCSRVNLANPNYIDDLVATVDASGIAHNYIDIELTESMMIGNEDALETLLNDLNTYGFISSIDDFGAGYSSLGLLKNINAKNLKLDRSFFGKSKNMDRSYQVVGGLIQLAHSLNMHVVAEGIETLEEVEALRTIHCDAIQGYYYAKPMPYQEFEEKYFNV